LEWEKVSSGIRAALVAASLVRDGAPWSFERGNWKRTFNGTLEKKKESFMGESS